MSRLCLRGMGFGSNFTLEAYKEEAEGVEDVISILRALNSHSDASTVPRLRLLIAFGPKGILSRDNPDPDRFLTGGVKLELPSLEYILIDVTYTGLRNLDFLLQLGSLKELELRYDKVAPKSEGWPDSKTFKIRSSELESATIQFGGFEDRLHESNIWTLLPELKQVSVMVTALIITMENGLNGAGSRILKRGVKPMFYKTVTYTRDGQKTEKVTYPPN